MPLKNLTLGAVAMAAWIVGCSYDFDAYDPRGASPDASAGGSGGLAGGSSGGTAGGGGTAGSSGTAGSGGSAGTGGSAGSGGSAGTGGSAGAGGTAGAGGAAGGGGAAGSGGTDAGPGTVSYVAAVADCVNLDDPDPDICEAASGAAMMSVDLTNGSFAVDGGPGSPSAIFLRFDVDATLSGKTVTAATVSLTVGSQPGNESNSTGELWTVTAFTRPALFSGVPSKVGSAPVASDLGAAALGATITFTLPTGLPQASTPLYFGLFPASTNGTDYQNAKGASPPTLNIDYQ